MKKVKRVEEAYTLIARRILNFIADRKWDAAGVTSEVTPRSVSFSKFWLNYQGKIDTKSIDWGDSEILTLATAAVHFLREELQRTTGQTIWGLTFKLFPDGKFKIEYDYNKPEGYEETDEVITGEEINQFFQDIAAKKNAPDQ